MEPLLSTFSLVYPPFFLNLMPMGLAEASPLCIKCKYKIRGISCLFVKVHKRLTGGEIVHARRRTGRRFFHKSPGAGEYIDVKECDESAGVAGKQREERGVDDAPSSKRAYF